MKRVLVVPFLYAVGLSIPAVTYADVPFTPRYFPSAGVDNAPALARYAITFEKSFAVKIGLSQDSTSCVDEKKRTFVTPLLYDAQTRVGRSDSHFDGDAIDEIGGAEVCKDGHVSSCADYFSFAKVPVTDGYFQWVEINSEGFLPWHRDGKGYNEGPSGSEEVNTQVVSFNFTPLSATDISANAVRAGSAAPDQPRSIGEVESIADGGFPADGFFNMYVEIDIDLDNDGIVDITVFNKGGEEYPSYPDFGGDFFVLETTNLNDFPPTKAVYAHNANRWAIPVYNKSEPSVGPVGWLRMASHGVGFDIEPTSGVNEFEAIFGNLPLLPIKDDYDCPSQVGLEFFTATGNDETETVSLEWSMTSEIGNTGSYIWRAKKVENGENVEYTVNGQPVTEVKRITEQLIPTQGMSLWGIPYSYEDSDVICGNTYYYALEDGVGHIHLDSIVSTTCGR